MPGTTDTVKAKLTPGEFVIRKEAVDMIGVPMLNKLNNMPEEGGHSAIDKIIDMATISNMKMMYGGGMVKPNYAGGGMIEDSLMGMRYGGMAKKKKMMGYEDGGNVVKERTGTELPAEVLEQPQSLGALIQSYKDQYDGAVPMSLYIRQLQGLQNPEQDVLAQILNRTPMFEGRPDLPTYRPEEFKASMQGYQEGGPVEEGIPLPPQPRDPLQIGARQADPSMYEGSTLGVRDQAMMLQDSIEQDTVNKARKTLQLMKLKGLLEGAESLDYQEPEMKKGAKKEMQMQMLKRALMMRGMTF